MDDDLTPGPVAVVINPSKFDDDADVRAQVEQACADREWPAPAFYETTVEDPGVGQAQQALADGASLVISIGGDGTTRAVAEAMADSGVPLGIIPAGTGNLLARSLATPLDLAKALDVVFDGRTRAIDIGELSADGRDSEAFLVMAGLGMDADVMAGVDDTLKKRIGWVAYLVSGLRAVFGKGFRVRLDADGRTRIGQHARTVLVGNVGQLQGGVMLMPEALIDDGKLDVLLASPKGVLGWGALIADIASRHRRGHRGVRRVQAETVTIGVRQPVEAQIDGDPIGAVRTLVCRVRPEALIVRVPPAERDEA